MNCRLFVITVLLLCTSLAKAQIVVIAHSEVVNDTITTTELHDIYTGDMTFWKDGEPIIVCDLNDSTNTHDQFYAYIGVNSSRIKSIWMKRMLSGESDPPLIYQSGAELSQHISELPGAIGFVDRQHISGKVKILLHIETPSE